LASIFSRDGLGPVLKFAVVGAVGVAVNEGLLLALLGAGVYLLAASVIAIEISILSNFVLNDLWTFKDRRTGTTGGRLLKFNALMLVGLVINTAVLDIGTAYLGMAASVANLVGIAVAFVVRYVLSVRYAWMKPEGEPGRASPKPPVAA
jgi:dolichol-phosphate mannosyltransferase